MGYIKAPVHTIYYVHINSWLCKLERLMSTEEKYFAKDNINSFDYITHNLHACKPDLTVEGKGKGLILPYMLVSWSIG